MVTVHLLAVVVLGSCMFQPTLTFGSHFDVTSQEARSIRGADFSNLTKKWSQAGRVRGSDARLEAKGNYSNELIKTHIPASYLGARFKRGIRSVSWPFQFKASQLMTAITTTTTDANATTPIDASTTTTTDTGATTTTNTSATTTTFTSAPTSIDASAAATTDAMGISSHGASEIPLHNISDDRSKISSDDISDGRSDIPSDDISDDISEIALEERRLLGMYTGCVRALFCQFLRCPNVLFRAQPMFYKDAKLMNDVMQDTTERVSPQTSVTDSTRPAAHDRQHTTDSTRPTAHRDLSSTLSSRRQSSPVTEGTLTKSPVTNGSLTPGLEVYDVEFINYNTTLTKASSQADLSCPTSSLLGEMCSCDMECVHFGDCCVDAFYSCHGLNTTSNIVHFIQETSDKFLAKHSAESYPSSTTPSLSLEDDILMAYGTCVLVGRYPEQHVMMVGVCPTLNVTDSAPRDECQASDHVLLPPVVGDIHDTRVTFKNVFCALCHGLNPDDLVAWSAEIHCNDVISGKDVAAMPDVDIIRHVYDGICNVTYHHPNLTCQPRYCQPGARLTEVQRSQLTQNVESGLCSADDMLLCRAYFFPDGGYKNPHCKKCLIARTALRSKRQVESSHGECVVVPVPDIRGGVLIILDLFGRYSGTGGKQFTTFNLCGDSQVYDPHAQTCRTLLCQNGYKPHQGKCLADARVSVVGDDLHLFPTTWRFLKFSINVTKYFNVSCEKMEQDLNTNEFWSLVNISLSIVPEVEGEPGMEAADVIERSCADNRSSTNHSSVASIEFLTELKADVNVHSLALVLATSRVLLTYLGPHQITRMWATNMMKGSTITCPDNTRLTTYTDVSLTDRNNVSYAAVHSEPPSLYPVGHIGFDVAINDLDPEAELELKAVHVCSDDLFNENCSVVLYSVNETSFNSSHLTILHTKQIYGRDRFKVRAWTVLVCSDFKFASRRTSVNSGDPVYRLLNWTMTSLACLFLLAMVVLYCVFPELGTLPGKMTASLAGTMMLTFMFNLLTLVDVHGPYICPVVAVISHIVTLAHFGWMSAIALHMALTFGSRAMTATGQRNSFLLYNIAVWGSSVAIVVTSVGLDLSQPDAPTATSEPMFGSSDNVSTSEVSHLTSTPTGFPRYGYPDCSWFSGAMWTRLAFVIIPFSLTYLNNIVCFTITLLGIHKASRNSAKVGKKRSDLTRCLIYFKLSTAMGFAWILSLLINFAPEEEALPYLVVVLVFLQGVLLFMAFMANRRVYRVVTQRIKLRTAAWRTSAQTTTTKLRVDSTVYSNHV